MWKRDVDGPAPSGQPAAQPQPAYPAGAATPNRPESSQKLERDIVNIGKSVVIKGELNGSEDLTIEGQVEGTIQLRDHILTIGANGKIKAKIFAKAVIVLGSDQRKRHRIEKGGHPRQRLGGWRYRVAARRHCRGRPFPRQRGHAAEGRRHRGAQGGSRRIPQGRSRRAATGISANLGCRQPGAAARHRSRPLRVKFVHNQGDWDSGSVAFSLSLVLDRL